MGQPHENILSLPPQSLVALGLNAGALQGAVDTSVLRLATPGAATIVGTAISVADNADNGSVFTIRERGIYLCEFATTQSGVGQDNGYGVSKDVEAAGLTAVPDMGIVGMEGAVRYSTATGEEMNVYLCVPVVVTAAEAAAGAEIRFHGAAVAGGPGIATSTALVKTEIRRIADYPA